MGEVRHETTKEKNSKLRVQNLAGCRMGNKIETGCGIREILRAGYGKLLAG